MGLDEAAELLGVSVDTDKTAIWQSFQHRAREAAENNPPEAAAAERARLLEARNVLLAAEIRPDGTVVAQDTVIKEGTLQDDVDEELQPVRAEPIAVRAGCLQALGIAVVILALVGTAALVFVTRSEQPQLRNPPGTSVFKPRCLDPVGDGRAILSAVCYQGLLFVEDYQWDGGGDIECSTVQRRLAVVVEATSFNGEQMTTHDYTMCAIPVCLSDIATLINPPCPGSRGS